MPCRMTRLIAVVYLGANILQFANWFNIDETKKIFLNMILKDDSFYKSGLMIDLLQFIIIIIQTLLILPSYPKKR